MSKAKKTSDVMDWLHTEWVADRDLTTLSATAAQLDALVENGLAIKINGIDDLMSSRLSRYRIACYYMCKKNKKFKENKRNSGLKFEYGSELKYADEAPEILELSEYSLADGTYAVELKDSNFAVLRISQPDKDFAYEVEYSLYFVGKKAKKYADKFFKLVDYYKSLKDKTKDQCIMYSDDTPTKQVMFKSMDKIVMDKKQEFIDYVDNFINNIPIYYHEHNMIPKLSLMIRGVPGTGKSTLAKGLADYLNIDTMYYLKPEFFQVDGLGMSDGYGRGGGRPRRRRGIGSGIPAVSVINDIDCICMSREAAKKEGKQKENDAVLQNLLAFLDDPETFYFKAKDGLYYPIQIVVATTNEWDSLDEAVRRTGRFDKVIDMNEFDEKLARELCEVYKLRLEDVVKEEIGEDFTIKPSTLQALCMENVDKALKDKDDSIHLSYKDKKPESKDSGKTHHNKNKKGHHHEKKEKRKK